MKNHRGPLSRNHRCRRRESRQWFHGDHRYCGGNTENTGSIGSQEKGAYRLVELSDYVGAVVYVEFWASYCVPCRESFPLLSELRDRFNRQTFEVIAVSNDVDPRDAKRFTETYKVAFPVLRDPSGYVAKTYGVKALPMGLEQMATSDASMYREKKTSLPLLTVFSIKAGSYSFLSSVPVTILIPCI